MRALIQAFSDICFDVRLVFACLCEFHMLTVTHHGDTRAGSLNHVLGALFRVRMLHCLAIALHGRMYHTFCGLTNSWCFAAGSLAKFALSFEGVTGIGEEVAGELPSLPSIPGIN